MSGTYEGEAKKDRDWNFFLGFLFAYRVMYEAHDLPKTPRTIFDDPAFMLLGQIADGEVTLADSPETAGIIPDDRADANVVLDELERTRHCDRP